MKQTPLYVGMDLGTSSTLVYIEGSGLVYNEPSVVAYNIKENRIVAIGNDAYKMVGKGNKTIRIVFPMKNGVIQDLNATKSQLNYIFSFKLKLSSRLKGSTILLACPSMITPLEKKALEQIATDFGASQVFVEEEVKMAALGGGVDIYKPQGNLVIDIGGGTTDVAVIASGDIVLSKSTKVAGSFLNEEILKYVRSKYGLEIGVKSAELVKKQIGSAYIYPDEKNMSIYGRDIVSGLPRQVNLTPLEIREVLIVQLSKILDCVVAVLETTPPELAGDIFQSGLIICGGGALIRGVEKYFGELLKLPSTIGEQPLLAVINGTKKFEFDIKNRIRELNRKKNIQF